MRSRIDRVQEGAEVGETCRGHVPWVPQVASYNPQIWI
jgi:hypothetical protein